MSFSALYGYIGENNSLERDTNASYVGPMLEIL